MKVPTGRELKLLSNLQSLAFDLIKGIEREKSGIRDGDGFWHGSDPIRGTIDELNECWQLCCDRQERNGAAIRTQSTPARTFARDATDEVPF